MINKLWFRTTDNFTIDEAQKQIGKEEKEKISIINTLKTIIYTIPIIFHNLSRLLEL